MNIGNSRTHVIKDTPKPEEEGELLIFGRSVMMGYLNAPSKTKDTIDAAGWMSTGDTAAAAAGGGFVKIVGRAKDIIVTSGGENVAPAPIEERIKVAL